MTAVQAPAQAQAKAARLVDADRLQGQLLARARKHEEQGRISHSLGVRSALDLIKRDLAKRRGHK